MSKKENVSFDEVVAFHGHSCPGLALGYRVSQTAMQKLKTGRPEDEELVAMVENDACGVDAVQYVCGCTFGKGNLVFRDYGKQGFTFYNRNSGEGVRIYAEPVYMDDPDDPEFVSLVKNSERTPQENARLSQIMDRRIQRILSMPEDDFLTFGTPQEPMPTKARIFGSQRCDSCKERVMETRLHKAGDSELCLACAGNQST